MKCIKRKKVCFLVIGVLFCAPLFSQSGSSSFIRGSRLYTGLHLEYWGFSQAGTLETVVPVYYSMSLDPLLEGLSIDAVTSPMFGTVIGNDVDDGLFGLSGTKFRTSYNIKNLLLATAGVQIPTGTNNLSLEQQNTVGGLGTRPMQFRVNRVGTGLDFDLTLSSSMEVMEDLVIGAGAGILTHGPFKPFENMQDYNPGNEFTGLLGMDYTLFAAERKISIMLDLSYTYYTADQMDNKNVMEPGSRISSDLSASMKLNPAYYNTVNIVYNFRGENSYNLTSSNYQPGGDLLITDYVHLLAYKKYHPYGIARMCKYFEDGQGLGSALTGGLGAGGSLKVSNGMLAKAHAVLDMGALNGSFLYGVELSGGLHYDF